jgi:hypothetical protein
LRAAAPFHDFRFCALAVLVDIPCVFAVRVAGAADEETTAAQAFLQGLAAFGTLFLEGGYAGALDVMLVIDELLERLPELFHQRHPLPFAT